MEYLSGVASGTLVANGEYIFFNGFYFVLLSTYMLNLREAKIRDSCPCLVENLGGVLIDAAGLVRSSHWLEGER